MNTTQRMFNFFKHFNRNVAAEAVFVWWCFFFFKSFLAAAGGTADEHSRKKDGPSHHHAVPLSADRRRRKTAEPSRTEQTERRPQEPLTGDKSGFYCLNARETPPETLSFVRKQPFTS